jgi:hypothetical protein
MLFYELLPFACEAGIDAREFWQYTLAEILITTEAYKKRLATQAMFIYKTADLTRIGVATLLDKKNKMPKPHEAFPGLIQEPSRSGQVDPYIAKHRMMKFAQNHNAKFMEKNK